MTQVLFQKWIFRADLKANPDVLYVFGDNMERVGMGGQAKKMRGEPNAVGIVTKWSPGMLTSDFFSDDDFDTVKNQIDLDFDNIADYLYNEGGTVVFPLDGLGTGLSELPTRAPKIYEYIKSQIQHLVAIYNKD